MLADLALASRGEPAVGAAAAAALCCIGVCCIGVCRRILLRVLCCFAARALGQKGAGSRGAQVGRGGGSAAVAQVGSASHVHLRLGALILRAARAWPGGVSRPSPPASHATAACMCHATLSHVAGCLQGCPHLPAFNRSTRAKTSPHAPTWRDLALGVVDSSDTWQRRAGGCAVRGGVGGTRSRRRR